MNSQDLAGKEQELTLEKEKNSNAVEGLEENLVVLEREGKEVLKRDREMVNN